MSEVQNTRTTVTIPQHMANWVVECANYWGCPGLSANAIINQVINQLPANTTLLQAAVAAAKIDKANPKGGRKKKVQ
jgi:hypothetical protein